MSAYRTNPLVDELRLASLIALHGVRDALERHEEDLSPGGRQALERIRETLRACPQVRLSVSLVDHLIARATEDGPWLERALLEGLS